MELISPDWSEPCWYTAAADAPVANTEDCGSLYEKPHFIALNLDDLGLHGQDRHLTLTAQHGAGRSIEKLGAAMRILELRVSFTAVGNARLPAHKGNLLRSALGACCKRVLGDEAYGALFEGRTGIPGQERVPPFALRCMDRRTYLKTGDRFGITFVLVKPEHEEWILALLPNIAGDLGGQKFIPIVTSRTAWDEKAILRRSAELVTARELKISLQSPLRIERRGHTMSQPTWQDVLQCLERRVRTLEVWLGQAPTCLVPENAGQGIVAVLDLTWFDWSRTSSRQQREISMGGVTGTIILTGDLKALLPLLIFGSIVGIGAGMTSGNGVIKIVPVDS